ncbi:hypothetical protein [Kordiimonas sp.]|uniref:hypothetical protein n=1 Tax=Kordiimonas sp. TaxID=1970157 RepID=UPI003A9584A5
MHIRTVNTSVKITRLVPWLIALFVAAQLIATAHAGAYGDSKHLHDGHPCIISTVCKQSSDGDLAQPAPVVEPREWQEFYAVAHNHVEVAAPVKASAIRGPPSKS